MLLMEEVKDIHDRHLDALIRKGLKKLNRDLKEEVEKIEI